MKKTETELIVCEICGVKAARVIKRPQILGRGARMILVDNVPIIACKNCGENYMTSATMHKLDDIRVKQKEKTAVREVTVAEFV